MTEWCVFWCGLWCGVCGGGCRGWFWREKSAWSYALLEVRRLRLARVAVLGFGPARLRGLVLAHGLAPVQHGRGASALGGRAATGAGELRQVVERGLPVHGHWRDTQSRGQGSESSQFGAEFMCYTQPT